MGERPYLPRTQFSPWLPTTRNQVLGTSWYLGGTTPSTTSTSSSALYPGYSNVSSTSRYPIHNAYSEPLQILPTTTNSNSTMQLSAFSPTVQQSHFLPPSNSQLMVAPPPTMQSTHSPVAMVPANNSNNSQSVINHILLQQQQALIQQQQQIIQHLQSANMASAQTLKTITPIVISPDNPIDEGKADESKIPKIMGVKANATDEYGKDEIKEEKETKESANEEKNEILTEKFPSDKDSDEKSPVPGHVIGSLTRLTEVTPYNQTAKVYLDIAEDPLSTSNYLLPKNSDHSSLKKPSVGSKVRGRPKKNDKSNIKYKTKKNGAEKKSVAKKSTSQKHQKGRGKNIAKKSTSQRKRRRTRSRTRRTFSSDSVEIMHVVDSNVDIKDCSVKLKYLNVQEIRDIRRKLKSTYVINEVEDDDSDENYAVDEFMEATVISTFKKIQQKTALKSQVSDSSESSKVDEEISDQVAKINCKEYKREEFFGYLNCLEGVGFITVPVAIVPSKNHIYKPYLSLLSVNTKEGRKETLVINKQLGKNMVKQCINCIFSHVDENVLMNHSEENHGDSDEMYSNIDTDSLLYMRCNHCDFVSINRIRMWFHFRFHHEISDVLKPFSIKELEKNLLSKKTYKSKIGKRYKCPYQICAEYTDAGPSMYPEKVLIHMAQTHSKRVDGEPIINELSEYEYIFEGYMVLEEWCKTKTGVRKQMILMCSICSDVSCTSVDEMNEHLYSMHTMKYLLFECVGETACQNQYVNSLKMKTHCENEHAKSVCECRVSVVTSLGENVTEDPQFIYNSGGITESAAQVQDIKRKPIIDRDNLDIPNKRAKKSIGSNSSPKSQTETVVIDDDAENNEDENYHEKDNIPVNKTNKNQVPQANKTKSNGDRNNSNVQIMSSNKHSVDWCFQTLPYDIDKEMRPDLLRPITLSDSDDEVPNVDCGTSTKISSDKHCQSSLVTTSQTLCSSNIQMLSETSDTQTQNVEDIQQKLPISKSTNQTQLNSGQVQGNNEKIQLLHGKEKQQTIGNQYSKKSFKDSANSPFSIDPTQQNQEKGMHQPADFRHQDFQLEHSSMRKPQQESHSSFSIMSSNNPVARIRSPMPINQFQQTFKPNSPFQQLVPLPSPISSSRIYQPYNNTKSLAEADTTCEEVITLDEEEEEEEKESNLTKYPHLISKLLEKPEVSKESM